MYAVFALGMETELLIALQKAIKAGANSPDSISSRQKSREEMEECPNSKVTDNLI